MFSYTIIDPRPTSKENQVKNIQEIKSQGYYCLGLEVTIQHFADLMDKNIDPQHLGGNSGKACIQEVFELGLKDNIFPGELYQLPKKIAFFTVRADLDSVGSMALVRWYMQADCSTTFQFEVPDFRIQQIGEADCYTQETEWSPRELFSGGYEQTALAAIAKAVSDFKVPLDDRVQWALEWLYGGEEPEGYRKSYDKEREQIREALDTGETKVTTEGKIAIVISKLRAATSIGYSRAPIVVALNPQMPSKNGPYKKFTICQFASGYCDISAALKELAELEPGWGGSPNIGGSPQGISSKLELGKVVEIVKKHLM